ncbi:beta-N-acetylhexosaminidase [Streptomyces echinatus]|uniref:beta-N-acetylhexosaminidase n=1 Tax=Streptomyces echinatus TaxID=67293 RepID=A0A7W9PQP9_9ACTN|nr:family 20 glycosylhydrolase [Streptomyces echinatus]MBB5925647.1 hexosaminidase [Streptomyces echinatus]
MSLPLIPAPATATVHEGTLLVSEALGVVASGELSDAAARFVADVRTDSGIALTSVPGAATAHGPHITLLIDKTDIDDVAPAAGLRADGKAITGDADERHGLEITSEGARVWGPTPEAVHRGLTSLRQLIAAHAQDGTAALPAVRIIDGPRFAWRGLSLDVVRTFHGPDVIRRVVDMCSLHKVNVLHLHLTDDQGWRIEVPSRPTLTEVGARGASGDRPGGYFSRTEMADLVAYAAERFVTVVPEIGMPGHATAAISSCPELAPAEAHSVDLGDGTSFGLDGLDPARTETWAFVEDVLDAVIPQFPHSAYVHIGGDEAYMPDEVHAAFVGRAAELVRARGKRVVGWQEIARASLSSADVVQYWMEAAEVEATIAGEALKQMAPPELLPILIGNLKKAQHDVPSALALGTRLLISPSAWLYFDRPHADASSDAAQEEARGRVGMPLYPAKSIRAGLEWDPVDDTPGVESDAQIAGVEAAMWCETVETRDELEFMLLPRLSGLAEKAWARRKPADWNDYAARLGHQSALWQRRGWNWLRSVEIDWA